MLQICKKMTHHNPNVDLVNDNVYTKYGIIPYMFLKILTTKKKRIMSKL